MGLPTDSVVKVNVPPPSSFDQASIGLGFCDSMRSPLSESGRASHDCILSREYHGKGRLEGGATKTNARTHPSRLLFFLAQAPLALKGAKDGAPGSSTRISWSLRAGKGAWATDAGLKPGAT